MLGNNNFKDLKGYSGSFKTKTQGQLLKAGSNRMQLLSNWILQTIDQYVDFDEEGNANFRHYVTYMDDLCLADGYDPSKFSIEWKGAFTTARELGIDLCLALEHFFTGRGLYDEPEEKWKAITAESDDMEDMGPFSFYKVPGSTSLDDRLFTASYGELMDFINSAIEVGEVCSIACEVACLPNVADRLSAFSSRVGNLFKTTSGSSLRAVLNNLLSKESCSPTDISEAINQLSNSKALSEVENVEDQSFMLSTAPSLDILGCTPLESAFVGSVFSRGLQLSGQAIGLMFCGIGLAIKTLFNVAKMYVTNLLIDPYEIEINNSYDDSLCIKDLQIQASPESARDTIPFGLYAPDIYIDVPKVSSLEEIPWIQDLEQWLMKHSGRWFQVDTLGAEKRVRFFYDPNNSLNGISLLQTGINSAIRIKMNWEGVLRPRALDFRYFSNITNRTREGYPIYASTRGPQTLDEFLSSSIDNASMIGVGPSSLTEADMLNCFRFGRMFDAMLTHYSHLTLQHTLSQGSNGSANPILSLNMGYVYGAVQGDHFANACGGGYPSHPDPITNNIITYPTQFKWATDYVMLDTDERHYLDAETRIDEYIDSNTPTGMKWCTQGVACDILHETLNNIIQANITQFDHWIGDAAFYPYVQDADGFSEGTYRLAKGSELAMRATIFLTVVSVIAVTAVALTVGTVVAAKIKKNNFFKRTQQQAILDQKMWNGEKLSPSERKRYWKNKKKLDGISLGSIGLPEVSSQSTNDSQSKIQETIIQNNMMGSSLAVDFLTTIIRGS